MPILNVLTLILYLLGYYLIQHSYIKIQGIF